MKRFPRILGTLRFFALCNIDGAEVDAHPNAETTKRTFDVGGLLQRQHVVRPRSFVKLELRLDSERNSIDGVVKGQEERIALF